MQCLANKRSIWFKVRLASASSIFGLKLQTAVWVSCSFVHSFKSEHTESFTKKAVVDVPIPKQAPAVLVEIIHRAISKGIKGCTLYLP